MNDRRSIKKKFVNLVSEQGVRIRIMKNEINALIFS